MFIYRRGLKISRSNWKRNARRGTGYDVISGLMPLLLPVFVYNGLVFRSDSNPEVARLASKERLLGTEAV